MSEEQLFVSGGFLTANPKYGKHFSDLVQILLSHGEDYTPQFVELGKQDGYKTIRFETRETEELAKKWDGELTDPPGWIFHRKGPNRYSILISKLPLRFNFVDINVEREYLRKDPKRIEELLEILRDIYNTLHPSYGDALLLESVRIHDDPLGLGKLHIGTNLERALPDIFWCNFFGPEYVEMFGADKVLSAPCYSVQCLPDGGAMLLTSPSPFDYLEDPNGFERLREKVKEHLGPEAFDTGDLRYQGKVPKIRYLEERKKGIAEASHSQASSFAADWLSLVGRDVWKDWLRDNPSLAQKFVLEMSDRRLVLDYSETSLRRLDEFLHRSNKLELEAPIELLKKVSAYVSQVIIRNTGAKWKFLSSEDMPSLWLNDVQLSPLARTQKVILEGDTFEHWYSFVTKELTPAVKRENRR